MMTCKKCKMAHTMLYLGITCFENSIDLNQLA